MRTSRWRLATMVSVALVGGYSGSVLAQDIDLQSAEWLTPVEAYVFSLDRCEMGMPERYTEDGAGKVVGKIPHTCEVTHSDPRLSGTLTTVLTEHCFTVGGCVNWGTMDLVGPEGTWSGWFNGTEYNWTGASKTDLDIVLTGSEAYEGLVTVQHATGPFWGPMILDGVIYAGDPPPARVMLMPPRMTASRRHGWLPLILRAPVSGSRAGRPDGVRGYGGDDQTSPAIHGDVTKLADHAFLANQLDPERLISTRHHLRELELEALLADAGCDVEANAASRQTGLVVGPDEA